MVTIILDLFNFIGLHLDKHQIQGFLHRNKFLKINPVWDKIITAIWYLVRGRFEKIITGITLKLNYWTDKRYSVKIVDHDTGEVKET